MPKPRPKHGAVKLQFKQQLGPNNTWRWCTWRSYKTLEIAVGHWAYYCWFYQGRICNPSNLRVIKWVPKEKRHRVVPWEILIFIAASVPGYKNFANSLKLKPND